MDNFGLVLLNKLTYALYPPVLCTHQCGKTFMTQEFCYRLAINFVVGCVLFYRSSHRRCSVRDGVLRDFAKFTGKHLYQSLFF